MALLLSEYLAMLHVPNQEVDRAYTTVTAFRKAERREANIGREQTEKGSSCCALSCTSSICQNKASSRKRVTA